jgi:PadR family transcriptional regulator, regulatory protein AphA
VQRLTTTSYVVLGLLALRRWSTYELAQQMSRSIHYYWPRAESHIYEEPKKLVAHGLATARVEFVGRRQRTVYAITPKGRRALRRWLAEPGSGPIIEFEGLVKVLFAEQGSKEELLATLRSLRTEAEEARRHHAELGADLAETGGPFPERLHVNALVFRFMSEQTELLIRWVSWAEEEIAAWPEDVSLPAGRDFGSSLRLTKRDGPEAARPATSGQA